MLYYLFQWLDKYDFPGAGMFGYTSFRALMAIILALLISSIWGDKFIDLLKRKQITETQRDANIDPFGVNKVGVPSMGGVIIIFAILIPCLLLGKLNNIYMILMLITTVWLGSLGFADDYIKIFKKDKEGLHGKFKIKKSRLHRLPSLSSRATTLTMPTSCLSWENTHKRRAGYCLCSSPYS